MDNRILSLSGGNQQKVLFARALATRAPVVLMDDPMRGVDVGTKQEVYAMLREEAAAGRTFIWYSTEMDEIRLCDRVYVFREGRIAAELAGDDINEENDARRLLRRSRRMTLRLSARRACACSFPPCRWRCCSPPSSGCSRAP